MAFKMSGGNVVCINRNFAFFLLSQGISNLGDAFQLIATTSLLVQITGSSLSAAFGLICGPVLSILISTFAGYISDAKSEKLILILIDLFRGIVSLIFISARSLPQIYFLILGLSTLDIFYNPPKRKFLAGILENSQLITGNSLLNGLCGAMFIIGPIFAGIVISIHGTDIAFFINGISFFISAFCIILTNFKISFAKTYRKSWTNTESFTAKAFLDGITYCANNYTIRKALLTGTVICFTTTSVNIAFYPFAFEVLKTSDKIWGLMMSIFYGASLLAMPLPFLFSLKSKAFYKIVVPASLLVISGIWYSYGNITIVNYILILQLLEGTIFSYINIMLTTHLQTKSKKDILGRVIGTNDLINNAGKIAGIGITFILLKVTTPNNVFLFCAIIISFFALYTIFLPGKSFQKDF